MSAHSVDKITPKFSNVRFLHTTRYDRRV